MWNCPVGDQNDQEEVDRAKRDSLLGVLDPDGVEVHVELGSDITVEHGVDVFQFVPASLLVKGVGRGIGSVPVATTTADG